MLAIIPARKGSKRLKDKNKRLLCGKPMIEYTIEEAKKSKYIDNIIISTDDPYMNQMMIKYAVDIHWRPDKLAGDDVPTIDVIKDIVKDMDVDTIVLLQPTSPLRTADDIDRCIEAYMTGKFSSIVTVKKIYPLGFELNGAVFVMSKELIMNEYIWDDEVGLIVMPYERSVDVDRKEDFELCEMIMETKK